jgi:hypothetical protein
VHSTMFYSGEVNQKRESRRETEIRSRTNSSLFNRRQTIAFSIRTFNTRVTSMYSMWRAIKSPGISYSIYNGTAERSETGESCSARMSVKTSQTKSQFSRDPQRTHDPHQTQHRQNSSNSPPISNKVIIASKASNFRTILTKHNVSHKDTRLSHDLQPTQHHTQRH